MLFIIDVAHSGIDSSSINLHNFLNSPVILCKLTPDIFPEGAFAGDSDEIIESSIIETNFSVNLFGVCWNFCDNLFKSLDWSFKFTGLSDLSVIGENACSKANKVSQTSGLSIFDMKSSLVLADSNGDEKKVWLHLSEKIKNNFCIYHLNFIYIF